MARNALPKRAAERIVAGLKRFQPILGSAKARDVNESDTVIIVMDLLHEVFGYDKYAEITSEHAIRGTYCDLAVKIDGSLALLIEVKAIGCELRDAHVKQAVDYAANQGVDWVVLTNGVTWRVYRVTFSKPIDQELVLDLDLLAVNPRDGEHVEHVGLVAKEGWQKAHLQDYHSQKQALSRFTIASLLLTEPLLLSLRRELKRISPQVRVETDDIKNVLVAEVLKRDVLEGDKADASKRQIARAAAKAQKASKSANEAKQSVVAIVDGADAVPLTALSQKPAI